MQFTSFQEELKFELEHFLTEQSLKYPPYELLKIDLHCHDYNSDVPDELLGRILNVPETWLKTNDLINRLQKNNTDLITITNHNNARSCFNLINSGMDLLTGCEFSCYVPDFNIGIHVLAYGFDEEQLEQLQKLRKNLYSFLKYAYQYQIPTVWAHPLYYYSSKGLPPMEFFNKMSVVFERFEIINGQRDTWQNMLVKLWITSLNKEKIDSYAEQFDIDPEYYCTDRYKKSFSGGSDDHMGIFAGLTGTMLYIPDLQEKRKTRKLSELALEAIREGRMAPYGTHQNNEKITITFLDYFCQIALNRKDPGLMRILLHKGSYRDKILALAVSNGFSELQRHKVTMNYLNLFHSSFIGKSPKRTKKLLVPKPYKPIFDEAASIAKYSNNSNANIAKDLNDSVNTISDKMCNILFERIGKRIEKLTADGLFDNLDFDKILEKIEFPSDLRMLFGDDTHSGHKKKKKMLYPNVKEMLDGLSFPALIASVILAANFTSSRVLYNTRSMLKSFSDKFDRLRHPKRMLWLTDTYDDKNGVSMSLQAMHQQIQERNLPIDILVSSNTLSNKEHLIVMKPVIEFEIPFYKEQKIRIPNFLELHKIFQSGEYDRIMCSTEGIMGLAALYLKQAFSVPAYFYLHTDWITFAKKVLKININNIKRLRRIIRAFYKAFDGIFVLNTDQQKWLSGTKMGVNHSRVFLTAHWADDIFRPKKASKSSLFGIEEDKKVILFAGRVSQEKGVFEIPEIYTAVLEKHPNTELVIAGTGPAEEDLKELIPDARFLGWIDHDKLPEIYSAADIMILPSRFDTFSCVVLEALSCSLPVIAYSTKGPKDIIEHNKSGYLVKKSYEMADTIIRFFDDENEQIRMKEAALCRAKQYSRDNIMEEFMKNIELS